jgi:hypothetical protein
MSLHQPQVTRLGAGLLGLHDLYNSSFLLTRPLIKLRKEAQRDLETAGSLAALSSTPP